MDKCKLFKITSPSPEIGECTEKYINADCIIEIKHYKGDCLHKGWNCSKLSVRDGMQSFNCYDTRLPDELYEFIKSLYK